MQKEKHGAGAEAALAMIEALSSVGVQFFDITHINIDGEKRGFRPKQSLEQTRSSIPSLVAASARWQNNLIVRPHQPRPVLLIQLDDLATAALDRLRPAAFLIIETSPGNHQAWLAVQTTGRGTVDSEFARRLRKGAGADPTASGATRVAGTANFKRKYEPDFPIVRIEAIQSGQIATPDALEALGLVAPPEPIRLGPEARKSQKAQGRGGRWPSYQYTLSHAPRAHGQDRPDISRADFTWALTAIDWGHSVEAVADRLMLESPKARENGPQYAMITATNAAAAIQRRYGAQQPEPAASP